VSAPAGRPALLAPRAAVILLLGSLAASCASDTEAESRARAVESFRASVLAAQDGDLDRAEALARDALEHAPTFVDPHFALARIEELRGDPDAARAHYLRALEVDPTQVRAGIALATTYFPEQRWDEAETWLSRAVEADPGAADAYFNLGFVAEARNDPDRAAGLLRLAAVLDQYDPHAPALIAGIRLAQGRLEDARAAADEALRREPGFPAATAVRAEIDRRGAPPPR